MTAELSDRHRDFLSLAATRLIFPGAKIQGRRLVPDRDHVLEKGHDKKTIMLRPAGGGGPGVTITCSCGLEGGGCVPVIMNPGEPDEHAVCVPDSGCGSSGLFCFMDFGFHGFGGFTLRVPM